MGTIHKALKEIRERHYFDEHEIERVRHGVWLASKRTTQMGSFYVVDAPGALLMYGDLGELTFLHYSHESSLMWGKRNFDPNYPYYPMTKLVPQLREQRFVPKEADDWLDERIEECKTSRVLDEKNAAHWKKIKARWDDEVDKFDIHEAERQWWEINSEEGECDPPGCRDWTTTVAFCFQAFCWFFTHVSKDDPRFSEEFAG